MKLNFTVKWDESKNEWLKAHRGISFEAVAAAIEDGRLLEDIEHPSPKRKHQRILVVEIDGYVCCSLRKGRDDSFLKTFSVAAN